MVGTKSGTKVVDRGDPKYKGAPEHESVVRENGDHPDMGDHDEKDEFKGKLKGRKSFKQFQKKDKEDQDKDPVGKKQDDLDRDVCQIRLPHGHEQRSLSLQTNWTKPH